MTTVRGKVAAITGAASGIGRALAVRLARQGCELSLSDVNSEGLEETVGLTSVHGVRVSSHRVDTSQLDQVREYAARTVSDHGRVNLVFNNAGVALYATVADLTYEDLEWLMDINFYGVVYGTKEFLPYLQQAEEAHIINVSSIFGIVSLPHHGAYHAAKFAVRGFTESLRQELEDTHIRVSCVHPGGIQTSIARSARANIPEDEDVDRDEVISNFEKNFLTTADKAAEIILGGVAKNRKRILVGPDARITSLIARLMPVNYDRILQKLIKD